MSLAAVVTAACIPSSEMTVMGLEGAWHSRRRGESSARGNSLNSPAYHSVCSWLLGGYVLSSPLSHFNNL